MTIEHLFLLALYVSVSVAGLTLMKLRPGLSDISTWLGFGLYGAGFCLWMLFLKRVPLSKAFPLAAGCLIVATQICGWYFLHENIGKAQMAGIAMMLLAVSVIFWT